MRSQGQPVLALVSGGLTADRHEPEALGPDGYSCTCADACPARTRWAALCVTARSAHQWPGPAGVPSLLHTLANCAARPAAFRSEQYIIAVHICHAWLKVATCVQDSERKAKREPKETAEELHECDMVFAAF